MGAIRWSPPMPTTLPSEHVEAFRGFNRFYTRQIGVLDEGLLDSPFTLTQARVLFELAQRGQAGAGEIGEVLGLDAGYLSRILQEFASAGLVARRKSPDDGRRVVLSLTAAGRKAFDRLDVRSRELATDRLSRLSPRQRRRVLACMREIQQALAPSAGSHAGRVAIRGHRIGDLGWAIERHGRLYAEEFGWNEEFEALVATLFAKFATRHDPRSERFWIAEIDGERVGCVFVVRNEEQHDTAQLRCLLVDPKGRGKGVGRKLVDECIAFARSAGYARMVLWTNDVLVAARRVYEAAGFSLLEENRHHSFGQDLVGQVWSLELRRERSPARG